MKKKKKKAHPLDDLSFEGPKLDEIHADEVSQPASTKKIETRKIETRASNITLTIPMWEWIDAKHTEARSKGGKPLRKSAIIRALFEVAMSADIDIAGVQSEDEIVERIRHSFK